MKHIDWILVGALVPIVMFGLLTVNSFGESNYFFVRQGISFLIALIAMFGVSLIDVRFLRRTKFVVLLYTLSIVLLGSLFFLGSIFKGARSWFDLGIVAFQPVDLAKIVLIILLAKYFSRRHVEIANIRHIIVSGLYASVVFLLVLVQPDFGSTLIIFSIWFGMVLVSGISKRHLLLVFILGAGAFTFLWTAVFQDYQKNRILTFLHPLADIQGAGYNAYQSTITVGAGQLFGRGVGYGTQSRLHFLPEYETDFIFAAFAEEWGFVGVVLLFVLFGIVIWRILANARAGETNFEILYGVGLSILFMSHFVIHVGMNIGILPVTGLPFPFLSYGGTNLLFSCIGIGILMSMRRYARAAHRDVIKNEFIGI